MKRLISALTVALAALILPHAGLTLSAHAQAQPLTLHEQVPLSGTVILCTDPLQFSGYLNVVVHQTFDPTTGIMTFTETNVPGGDLTATDLATGEVYRVTGAQTTSSVTGGVANPQLMTFDTTEVFNFIGPGPFNNTQVVWNTTLTMSADGQTHAMVINFVRCPS